MVNRGLATKREDTNSKRNKLIYTITENGRDYLKKWLSLPIEKELPYLLQAETVLNKCLNENTTHKYYLLTVEFGIKTYQTYLEWCKEAKKLLAGG